MQQSFFEFLREHRADHVTPVVHETRLLYELQQQMRRLISTRRAPVPVLRSTSGVQKKSTLLEVDRLLSYGFEQPGRVHVTQEKDLQILQTMVKQCIARHLPASHVHVNVSTAKSNQQGRTIVPVNVGVRTREVGPSYLEVRFDRLARDVVTPPEPTDL